MDKTTIEHFLHAQVRAWNVGDKEGFFAAYRSVAPESLQIEYVGRGPAAEGWTILEGMWAQQNSKIEIEEVALIINGSEVACHNRNKVRGNSLTIETIELYHFDNGRLTVRYFIHQP